MGFGSYLKKSFTLLILAAALTSGQFLSAPIAHGESQLQSILKEVAEKIEKVVEIKNNNFLKKEEREKQELLARKEALEKIFELTLLEDKDLKNRLLILEELSPTQIKIKNALLNLLEENENAYGELRPRLENAANLDQIKQLATDFKNWRQNVYNPKVEKILSFSLVFQQKNTLLIANDRLEKIRSTLQQLEDSEVVKKEDTSFLIKKAAQALSRAEDLNKQAKELVTEILNKEFFPITPNSDLTNINNPDELKLADFPLSPSLKESSPSVKSLIQDSLSNIKTAYRLFLDIGKIVREKSK